MPTPDPTPARTVRAGQAEHYRLSPTDTLIPTRTRSDADIY